MHWKLSGLDQLGEDFTVAADSGIVEPKSEYALNAYFRAMKPVTTSKKTIRLEVGIYRICDISEQSHDGITVMCISIGIINFPFVPNGKFIINVSQNLGTIQPN